MKISADYKDEVLYVRILGDVDEHSATLARKDADKLADNYAVRTQKAVFDLQSVSFMDSTGIGFLLGRYKKFLRYGVPMYVTNPSASTDKILQMSGVYTLIPRI